MSLRDDLIASVNKSWPKDLIIRYLYVKLAPTFQRDPKFFLASSYVQSRLYRRGLYFDGVHVYCKSICEYYKDLFQKFGIEAEIIQTNNKLVPHHGLIVRGDTDLYFIDPLKDLGLNQLGCATRFYGVLPLSTSKDNTKIHETLTVLSLEYLKEMDEELGLLQCGMYMDDFFLELKKDLFSRTHYDDILGLIGYDSRSAGIPQGINIYSRGGEPNDTYIEAKIELMNRYLINLGNVPGTIERQQLYQFILQYIFSKEERQKLKLNFSLRNEVMLIHHYNYNSRVYVENKDENGVFRLK